MSRLSKFSLTLGLLLFYVGCDAALTPVSAADDPKPHLPTPPCPNCQCGCTKTGNCTCKDCDHPLLVADKTEAPAVKFTWERLGAFLLCYADGKYVGTHSCESGVFYSPAPNGTLVVSKPPCNLPKDAATVPAATYTAPSFSTGGCANGQCGAAPTRGLIFKH